MAGAPLNGNARAAPGCPDTPARVERYTWRLESTVAPAKGVVLLVHGLNTEPEAMNDLAVELNNMGLDVLRVDLTGHGSNPRAGRAGEAARLERLARVSADRWLEEVACAHDVARRMAVQEQVPLFLVAHSLGALLGVSLVNRGQGRFDRMVLLAPALRTRWYTRLVRALAFLPGLTVASAAPPGFRANAAGTPIAAYSALFALQDGLAPLWRERVDVPTLVIVDEEDELVSAEALRQMIGRERLGRWSGVAVRKSPGARSGMPHHLIFAPEALGESSWRAMMARIRAHLLGGE